MSEPTASYALPSALITRADLARLVREVEDVDNQLEAQKARGRATGQQTVHMPGTSQGLNDFADLNKLDLVNDQARMHLKEQLKVMKDKAPVVHLTFATEADPASLKQLAEYIRRELHPQALLHVGLQPALVGGVYLRTPNHVHDFSIRSKLSQSRGVIQQDIDQLLGTVPLATGPSAPAVTTGPLAVAEPDTLTLPAAAPQPAPAAPHFQEQA